ncbi:P-loop containing nucleoside triphosphate hydrolase protein [Syncephalastrum racemosum]|uniref:P-loop containing nucleoside triphosphate hydrolase protein n=1 Tax=Syncephalastrum racemosum TaxID=13706 RepID=A0A1X2HWC1_SYNRA|nr:P-loop containing nucleoside triphosphate hydrolase protein [Syncephalastrum racemosum]
MTKDVHRQLVIVGDGACGKTCLLIVYSLNRFPDEHIPTVFDTYVKDIEVDGKPVELALWDTAGQETFDRLRTLSYPDADVVLIAFSIGDPETLENVREKWIGEVLHYCHGLPYFLVGCKKDLRHDPDTIKELKMQSTAPVTYEQGLAVSREIGARDYIECSAKQYENISEVFDKAARAALRPRKRSGRCTGLKCVPL